MMKRMALLIIIVMFGSFVSAGVGIKWDKESALINEGEKTCLTYKIYNPWPEETYATIELSDELKEILTMQEAETKLIPENTASSEAIPVEFCFKSSSEVYERDCWLAGRFICKQECNEEQKIYSGDVLVQSVPDPTEMTGTGGSTTTMAVSAPLNIKIRCNPHSRDFTLIYAILLIVSLGTIGILLYRKYRKPKSERYKEELKNLKKKFKKEKK